MTGKYAALDAAIIARLHEDRSTMFGDIAASSEVFIASDALVVDANKKPGWRFVDSRLQALRQAGRIKYRRKSATSDEGWVLKEGRKS